MSSSSVNYCVNSCKCYRNQRNWSDFTSVRRFVDFTGFTKVFRRVVFRPVDSPSDNSRCGHIATCAVVKPSTCDVVTVSLLVVYLTRKITVIHADEESSISTRPEPVRGEPAGFFHRESAASSTAKTADPARPAAAREEPLHGHGVHGPCSSIAAIAAAITRLPRAPATPIDKTIVG